VKPVSWIAGLLLVVGLCLEASAQSKPDSSIVGWRGNWTGEFPSANPPTQWSKISKPMKGLRCRADKPADENPAGTPASSGSLGEWLVLGPFAADDDAQKALDAPLLADEATCRPADGDAAGKLRWKKVAIAGGMVDFAGILAGDMPADAEMKRRAKHLSPEYGKPYVAYAHTYVYSAVDATFHFRAKSLDLAKVYVNGQLALTFDPKKTEGDFTAALKKGWNRVLLKARNEVVPAKTEYYQGLMGYSSWYVDLGLIAPRPYETESEGIAWATLVPSYHVGSPLIVGDRVFVMSYPGDLVCIRKSDGKVLWIRPTTYWDVLSDEDKKGNPTFAAVEPLVAEMRKIDAAYVEKGTLATDAIKKRIALHRDITDLVAKADKKYRGAIGHYVLASMPTPVSDGKHVYVWSELGIATCFDLEGNREWIRMPSVRECLMGRYASPVLADGKFIVFDGPGQHEKDGLVAFDARTGEVAWSMQHDPKAEPFSSLVTAKIAGEEFVIYGKNLVRAKDGKVVLEFGPDLVCHVPTPMVVKGVMYGIACLTGDVFKAKLPTDLAKPVMTNESTVKGLGYVRSMLSEGYIGSPLYHDGLLYLVDQTGYLYVVDDEAQKIVYERDLGMGKVWPYDFYHAPNWERPATLASPILAGKYVYVFGMNGTTVIFEAGREYKEVARNKIEDCLFASQNRYVQDQEIPEFFASSPVAEGDRIYLRGGNFLYCLGKSTDKGPNAK